MAPKKDLSLEGINRRLEGSGVRLEQRGGKLYLRATLPNKRGDRRSQQRISLGVNAIVSGLEYAEAKAWELASQKSRNAFSWSEWQDAGEGLTDVQVKMYREALRMNSLPEAA